MAKYLTKAFIKQAIAKAKSPKKEGAKDPTWKEIYRFLMIDHRLYYRIASLGAGATVSYIMNNWLLLFPVSMILNMIIETYQGCYRRQDASHVAAQTLQPVRLDQRQYGIYRQSSYWTRLIAITVLLPGLTAYFIPQTKTLINAFAIAGASCFVAERIMQMLMTIANITCNPHYRTQKPMKYPISEVDHVMTSTMQGITGNHVTYYRNVIHH